MWLCRHPLEITSINILKNVHIYFRSLSEIISETRRTDISKCWEKIFYSLHSHLWNSKCHNHLGVTLAKHTLYLATLCSVMQDPAVWDTFRPKLYEIMLSRLEYNTLRKKIKHQWKNVERFSTKSPLEVLSHTNAAGKQNSIFVLKINLVSLRKYFQDFSVYVNVTSNGICVHTLLFNIPDILSRNNKFSSSNF